jgi:hypothetical protein
LHFELDCALINVFSTLDSQPSSLRHRIGGTIEAELVKTFAVCC